MVAYVLGATHADTGNCDACRRWVNGNEWPRLASLLVGRSESEALIKIKLCRKCLREAFYAAGGKITGHAP